MLGGRHASQSSPRRGLACPVTRAGSSRAPDRGQGRAAAKATTVMWRRKGLCGRAGVPGRKGLAMLADDRHAIGEHGGSEGDAELGRESGVRRRFHRL